jgi:diguanylate cyclase (GGDEF)-like protein
LSRAQTLVFALLVLHVLLGVLAVVVGRGEHKSPALRWWGWGLLVYAAGLLFTLPAQPLPRSAGLFLGNGLITVAPVLCALGVLSHTRFQLATGWVVAGVGITLLVLAVANFDAPSSPLFNLVAPTVMATVMFLLAAWVIVFEGPREARMACRFLAAMMVVAVITWITRIVAVALFLEGTNDTQRVDFIISFFAIAQMVTGVGATLALFWIDVRIMQAELSRVAHTDHLTGLPNRRAILMRFEEEVSRAARHGHRFALAIFDLDHFKQVNDRHGHAVGDEVLKAASSAFVSAKRSEDVLARIGGEEFLVILSSQQSLEGAKEAADRFRDAVSRIELRAGSGNLRPTVSGGVALYPEDGSAWDALFAAADRRLYGAKRGGRNRVEASG